MVQLGDDKKMSAFSVVSYIYIYIYIYIYSACVRVMCVCVNFGNFGGKIRLKKKYYNGKY
jgi:hypothetical protein